MALIELKSGTIKDIKTQDLNATIEIDWVEYCDSETYKRTNQTSLHLQAYLCRKNGNLISVENKKLTRIFKVDGTKYQTYNDNITFNVTSARHRIYNNYNTENSLYPVTHNPDGSKTVEIGFYMYMAGPNSVELGSEYNCFKVAAQYAEIELTTIKRTTEPVFSKTTVNVNGEDSIAITLKPAVSTHKHKLKYNFGSWPHGQSAGISIGNGFSAQGNTTVTFTPPKNLWERAADEDTICTFRCETYDSSGNYIGYEDTYLYFADVVLTPVQPADWPTGLEDIIVQGQTSLEIKVNRPKFPSPYLYYITVEDYWRNDVLGFPYTDKAYEVGTLDESGEKAVVVEVYNPNVDGSSKIVFSENITIEAHNRPIITDILPRRDVSDETTVLVTVKGKVSPLGNKNANTLTVELNVGNETATQTLNPAYDFECEFRFEGITSDDELRGFVSLDDYFLGTYQSFSVGTGEVIMDFHRSGKGVAIGKVSQTEDLFEVDWDLQCNKSITADEVISTKTFKRKTASGVLLDVLDTINTKDYVTAEGTTTVATNGQNCVWRYRMWSSGFAECWGSYTVSGVSLDRTLGSLYYKGVNNFPAFPFEFTETPDVHLSWTGTDPAQHGGAMETTTKSPGNTYLYSGSQKTGVNGKFAIYAYGKWK